MALKPSQRSTKVSRATEDRLMVRSVELEIDRIIRKASAIDPVVRVGFASYVYLGDRHKVLNMIYKMYKAKGWRQVRFCLGTPGVHTDWIILQK